MGSTDDALDEIHLRGISASGMHGVNAVERRVAQPFVADVVLYLDTRDAAAADSIKKTADYAAIAVRVHDVLTGESVELVETLAERIAAVVLETSRVKAVKVTVHKPKAPLLTSFDDVAVVIRRDRDQHPPVVTVANSLSGPIKTVAPAAVPTDDDSAADAPAVSTEPEATTAPSGITTIGEFTLPEMTLPDITLPEFNPPRPLEDFLAADGSLGEAADDAQPDTAPIGLPGPAVLGTAAPAPTPISGSDVAVPLDQTLPDVMGDVPTKPTPIVPAASGPIAVVSSAANPDVANPDSAPSPAVHPAKLDQAPTHPVEAVLGLGSNLGDSKQTLREAVAELGHIAGVTVQAVSPLVKTRPVGAPAGSPEFLNAVVVVSTLLSPRELLAATSEIETAHGRHRSGVPGEPRTLDIDLITFGDVVASDQRLTVPHPKAAERAFVLVPWAKVQPHATLLGLGGGPVAALADTAPDLNGIRWLNLDWLTDG